MSSYTTQTVEMLSMYLCQVAGAALTPYINRKQQYKPLLVFIVSIFEVSSLTGTCKKAFKISVVKRKPKFLETHPQTLVLGVVVPLFTDPNSQHK